MTDTQQRQQRFGTFGIRATWRGLTANVSVLVGIVALLGAGNLNGLALGQEESAEATPVALNVPEGFVAERLYDVPAEQGSWVSLTSDDKGRLIASDQYGKLYRVTLEPERVVEPIDVPLGRAQGLLVAFDALYVVAHGGDGKPAGLYRVTDQDGDDQYDQVELLREFRGGGEHGPHAVILSPDGESLTICGGNHTDIPSPEKSRVPRAWEEDQVLPRLPDANGHATGRMAPAGWICRTDPDGKEFELISCGYRNEYDIAFDPNGELFTYDADMEWDVGLPWYRPTRVCHATSGSEFGWRYGTGKWPEYYPDSLPASVDIGPGSPTGIVFGTGAKFPARYQQALFIADWSYGIIYAVHLTPDGASFSGEKEVFCSAPALPVTDMVIHPTDGSLYFLVGGRRAKSGLYRIRYAGPESTAAAPKPAVTAEARLRHALEANHHAIGDRESALAAIDEAWEQLAHPDRFIRFAARVVLEHQDPELWAERALSGDPEPQRTLEAMTALIRVGNPDANAVVQAHGRLDWEGLSEFQRLHLLRNLGLVKTRLGELTEFTKKAVEVLASTYPTGSRRVDRELVRLAVAADIPSIVTKAALRLQAADSQEEQIFYALALSSATEGWDADSRKIFFDWFLEAAKLQGGNSFGGYLNNIRQQAIDSMTAEEKAEFESLIARQPQPVDPYADLKARPVVKEWTMDDLLPIEESEFENRNLERGKELFAIASCYKCHRINGNGGIVGPDLTPAGRRFTTRDLLETLIDPNKEVSDQYRATVFLMEDGRTLTGRVVNLSGDSYRVQTDMIKPNQMASLNVNEIEGMKPSTVSMMPAGLLDTMTREEILDLLAYMKSTSRVKDGDADAN